MSGIAGNAVGRSTALQSAAATLAVAMAWTDSLAEYSSVPLGTWFGGVELRLSVTCFLPLLVETVRYAVRYGQGSYTAVAFVLYGPVMFLSVFAFAFSKLVGNYYYGGMQQCTKMVLWPLGTMSMTWITPVDSTFIPTSSGHAHSVHDSDRSTRSIRERRSKRSLVDDRNEAFHRAKRVTETNVPASLFHPLAFGLLAWLILLFLWSIVLYFSVGLGYFKQTFYVTDYFWTGTLSRRCVALHAMQMLLNIMLPVYPMESSFLLSRVLHHKHKHAPQRAGYVLLAAGLLMAIPFMVVPNGIIHSMAQSSLPMYLHIALLLWILVSSAHIGYCTHKNKLQEHPLFYSDIRYNDRDDSSHATRNMQKDCRAKKSPSDPHARTKHGHSKYHDEDMDIEDGNNTLINDDDRGSNDDNSDCLSSGNADIYRNAFDEIRDANHSKDTKTAPRQGENDDSNENKIANDQNHNSGSTLQDTYYNRSTDDDESTRASQTEDDDAPLMLLPSSGSKKKKAQDETRSTPGRSTSWSSGFPRNFLARTKSDEETLSSNKNSDSAESSSSSPAAAKTKKKNKKGKTTSCMASMPLQKPAKRRNSIFRNKQDYSVPLTNETGHDTVTHDVEQQCNDVEALPNNNSSVIPDRRGPARTDNTSDGNNDSTSTFNNSFGLPEGYDPPRCDRQQRNMYDPYHRQNMSSTSMRASPIQFNPSKLSPVGPSPRDSYGSAASSRSPSSRSRSRRSIRPGRSSESASQLPFAPATPSRSGRRAPKFDPFRIASPASPTQRSQMQNDRHTQQQSTPPAKMMTTQQRVNGPNGQPVVQPSAQELLPQHRTTNIRPSLCDDRWASEPSSASSQRMSSPSLFDMPRTPPTQHRSPSASRSNSRSRRKLRASVMQSSPPPKSAPTRSKRSMRKLSSDGFDDSKDDKTERGKKNATNATAEDSDVPTRRKVAVPETCSAAAVETDDDMTAADGGDEGSTISCLPDGLPLNDGSKTKSKTKKKGSQRLKSSKTDGSKNKDRRKKKKKEKSKKKCGNDKQTSSDDGDDTHGDGTHEDVSSPSSSRRSLVRRGGRRKNATSRSVSRSSSRSGSRPRSTSGSRKSMSGRTAMSDRSRSRRRMSSKNPVLDGASASSQSLSNHSSCGLPSPRLDQHSSVQSGPGTTTSRSSTRSVALRDDPQGSPNRIAVNDGTDGVEGNV